VPKKLFQLPEQTNKQTLTWISLNAFLPLDPLLKKVLADSKLKNCDPKLLNEKLGSENIVLSESRK